MLRYCIVVAVIFWLSRVSECKVEDDARELPEDDVPDTNNLRGRQRTNRRTARLSLEQYYGRLLDDYIYGLCIVRPNTALPGATETQSITGTVDFSQSLQGGPTSIKVNLTGFDSDDSVVLHGLHIHEFGDLNEGCESTGGHYNPFGTVHGAPDDSPEFRHFGDLGNVMEDSKGDVEEEMSDYLVSLLGPFSILGRSVVMHANTDDLGRGEDEGSLQNGNAGTRLGCCTIGLSDGQHWDNISNK